MPLQSFDRVGCLRRSNRVPRRRQRIGSSRCSPAAFWALMPGIPAAKQAHARVRARARATRARGGEAAARARVGAIERGGAEATTVQTRLRGLRPAHAAATG